MLLHVRQVLSHDDEAAKPGQGRCSQLLIKTQLCFGNGCGTSQRCPPSSSSSSTPKVWPRAQQAASC